MNVKMYLSKVVKIGQGRLHGVKKTVNRGCGGELWARAFSPPDRAGIPQGSAYPKVPGVGIHPEPPVVSVTDSSPSRASLPIRTHNQTLPI